MDYPIWDIAFGGSMLMAVVAIAHVIVSHFAIGGGLVIAVTETLSVRHNDHEMRELARRGSLMLILVSTVFGAISGVGIWVVAGLISPGAIASLIHNYVWGWAIEWTFFVVEIVAALVYYLTWGKISKRAHLMVGWIYFVAAYLSLVIINGIITFMLTPGTWLQTHAFWDGFFNPTYWPSLALRTGIAVIMASAFLLFLTGRSAATARLRLTRYLAMWMVGGVLVAYGGYRWWEASLPDVVTNLFRGTQPVLATLATTRSLALWALLAALVLGFVLLAKLPRGLRNTVVVITAIAAFTFFGSYERLREGTRKPFLVHSYMFSNGLRVADINRFNDDGVAAHSGWVALKAHAAPEEFGRAVFRAQCASCHTLDGYQAIRPLLPTSADMLAFADAVSAGNGEAVFARECARCHTDYTYADMSDVAPTREDVTGDPAFIRDLVTAMITTTLEQLHDMGSSYAQADPTRMIDTRAFSRSYMPPFVGTQEELDALSAYLMSLGDRAPNTAQTAAPGGE